MGNVLIQSMILMIMIALGFLLKKIKIFGRQDYKVVNRMVMYVTLPCTIITSFTKFEWKNSLFIIPIFALVLNIILQILSYFLSRKGNDQDKIFYMLNTPGFSTGTFAIPFIQNIMGVEGIVAACMFDSFGTFMPSGVSYLSANAALSERKERINPAFIITRLLKSPPFVANIGMIILKMISVELPGNLILFTSKIANANTCLCMFMIGMMFEVKLDKRNLCKIGKLMAVRLGMAVLAGIFVMCVLPLEYELKKALTIVVFSPIAALALVFTDKMKGDTELAAFANSVSILVSMVIMTTLITVL